MYYLQEKKLENYYIINFDINNPLPNDKQKARN